VIGDLAGMAAATYARGLSWIVLPTSLMAQVDSAIGGKVGINLESAKNLVGSFWLPRHVVVDPSVLATLPGREFTSGLAEVVKYAVLQGPDAFQQLQANAAALAARDPQVVEDFVARCIRVKASIVQSDWLERTGERAQLNYGHTFAHAIEKSLGFGALTHGEAVAIGMCCAARLAQRRELVDDQFCRDQEQLIQRLGLPTHVADIDRRAIGDALVLDKKNRAGKLRFVLPSDWGRVAVHEGISIDDALAALSSNSS
jgi:3-dehydroquinate synthase